MPSPCKALLVRLHSCACMHTANLILPIAGPSSSVKETPLLEDGIADDLLEDAPLLEDGITDEDASLFEDGIADNLLEDAPLLEDEIADDLLENAPLLEDEIADDLLEADNLPEDGIADGIKDAPSVDTPLYPEASFSLHVALILILAFVVNHKLSNEALEDLLSLIGTLLLPSHILPKTLYKFYKLLNIKQSDIIRHHFCPACSIALEKDTHTCPNPACTRHFSSKSEVSYFVQLPLEKHLQDMFSRPGFLEQINHRFERPNKHANTICDVYDGSVYKNLEKNDGILSKPGNISLLWNTDGIPVFKSSNNAIWPLYFIINELPYRLRMKWQNVILAGLWFGSKKPNMKLFLRPFYTCLSKLETEGLLVKAWGASESFVVKCVLLAGTCDLPAKCIVQNFRQFNGFYGCSKCLQPGSTFTLGPNRRTHVYPYISSNPTGPLRTKQQTIQDIQYVATSGEPKNGVLGPSWLTCLRHFDIIRGTGIDYMHGCLLGIAKRMLNLWLTTEHKHERYYIGGLIGLLDRRLTSIQPPSDISRIPRSLSDRKHWKASEYRSFLLYYSLPLLLGVLPLDYFQHFSLLVVTLRMFLSENITASDLKEGKVCLDLFCRKFGSLYGEQHMGINVHSLLHLTSTVEELGPLWAYSCFSFEGVNGLLLKNLHGTQGIALQCMRTYNMIQAIPTCEVFPTGSKLEELRFVKELVGGASLLPYSRKTIVLGKIVLQEFTDQEKRALDAFFPQCSSSCNQYQRVRSNRQLYSTKQFSQTKKRCDSVVYFMHSRFSYGQVQKIVQADIENQLSTLIIIRVYECSKPFDDIPLTIKNFFSVRPKNELIVIKAENVLGKCVSIGIDEMLYVTSLVNTFEKD